MDKKNINKNLKIVENLEIINSGINDSQALDKNKKIKTAEEIAEEFAEGKLKEESLKEQIVSKKFRIVTIVPNALCLVRLILALALPFIYFYCSPLAAFITVLIAVSTDLVDGFIARKFNAITKTGIWLDPVADKVLKLLVLATLTLGGRIHFVVIVVLAAMEIALMITGAILYNVKKYLVPSNIVGKLASVIIYFGLMFLFFDVTLLAGQIMLYTGLVVTFISGFIYFLKTISRVDKK